MTTTEAAPVATKKKPKAEFGPRAKAAAHNGITSARQLFRVATGGLADLIHGDVTSVDSHAMSRTIENVVAIANSAGNVDRIMAECKQSE